MCHKVTNTILACFLLFLYNLFAPLFLAECALVVMVVFLLNLGCVCFLLGFSTVLGLEAAGFFAFGIAFSVSCSSLSFEASFMSASRCRSSQKAGV